MRISRTCSSTGPRHPDVYFCGTARTLDLVPSEFNPGVADRIKVFEDLIRASNGQSFDSPPGRAQRSRSCPARSRDARTLCNKSEQQLRLGSNGNLFSGSSSPSSGYTSTSPPSPSELVNNVRSNFVLLGFPPPPVDHKGAEEEDEEEEKRIEREIFSLGSQCDGGSGLLFSSASTDEDTEQVNWSDLEAEIVHEKRSDLDKVVVAAAAPSVSLCLPNMQTAVQLYQYSYRTSDSPELLRGKENKKLYCSLSLSSRSFSARAYFHNWRTKETRRLPTE